MKTSVRWLCRYLAPRPAMQGTPQLEALAARCEQALMDLGLPSENRELVQTCDGPDVCLDVEVTSNRGDCLSHVGLARELGASPREPGLSLGELPAVASLCGTAPAMSAQATASVITLQNQVPEHCPRFLVRVIRGVKVGPSPAWLRACLEGAGQRPINNVVDATNFIALELGNPCHAFDLAKLAGGALVVRRAREGEKLTTLDGKARVLTGDEIVVADAQRPQSLAGVMGGGDSEVSEHTVDVVLEVATWDPVSVRRAARRHQLRTTASHRYERIVDARTLDLALQRGAELIAALTGGQLLEGRLEAGRSLPQPTTARLRPERVRALLGYEVERERMLRHLRALEIEVGPLGRGGDDLLCTIPPHRPDLTREVDLIEEVARVEGLEAAQVQEAMRVRVKPPQARERARAEVGGLLASLGFFESITFSFTSERHATLFTPSGLSAIVMDDARRGDEPALRPSVLTGLLACRTRNQHAGVTRAGGVRLFEMASAFAQRTSGGSPQTVEHANLGLLLDCAGRGVDDLRAGVRAMRGVVEALVRVVGGEQTLARMRIEPAPTKAPAYDPAACAQVLLDGQSLGFYALLDKAAQAHFDLSAPVVVGELDLEQLLALYPPRSRVYLPPSFPAIERDVSLVVDEGLRYAAILEALDKHKVPPIEDVRLVTIYRGKPLAAGTKSVTVRLSCRDASRTLTHDEVDAPVGALLGGLRKEFSYELRT